MDLSRIGQSDFFDTNSFSDSMSSASTWGSVASSMATTGMQSGLTSSLSPANNKFYGGMVSLASSGAGQAANYGVQLAYAGGDWGQAYDNMGGITLNLVNAGALVDMFGSGIARNNATGQSKLGEVAKALNGTGLLEMNIGSDGITSRIGMGGIDVGGSMYTFAKRMNDKAALSHYASTHSDKAGKAAYNAYVYGDWTQENTAARLASGKDTLSFSDGTGKSDTWVAQTTQNSNGGRDIEMLNNDNEYTTTIQLGHEAYRDGFAIQHNVKLHINTCEFLARMARNSGSKATFVALLHIPKWQCECCKIAVSQKA